MNPLTWAKDVPPVIPPAPTGPANNKTTAAMTTYPSKDKELEQPPTRDIILTLRLKAYRN
jgi:hypothetical protein